MPLRNTVGCTMLLRIDLVQGSGLSKTHDSVCLFWVTTAKLHTGTRDGYVLLEAVVHTYIQVHVHTYTSAQAHTQKCLW